VRFRRGRVDGLRDLRAARALGQEAARAGGERSILDQVIVGVASEDHDRDIGVRPASVSR
jgi:hypothetical protein